MKLQGIMVSERSWTSEGKHCMAQARGDIGNGLDGHLDEPGSSVPGCQPQTFETPQLVLQKKHPVSH